MMIRIDHISFEFTATGEDFAYGLYAGWDGFCRECFEKVVEECLSGYDKDKVLHEIETISLDLGGIPEEDFYREFPIRLKEELLKALPSFNISSDAVQEEKTGASRIANLLFYLEYGYLKTEWADSDFSLTEELKWVVSQHMLYRDEIVKLCLIKEHAMRRLLWQMNDEKILVCLYSATLSNASVGLGEKRRFLEMLLEIKSGIPLRFIHEATDDAELRSMAELLDTFSVRRIMETETEEHAEVNLPSYWHYLYEWLVRYYPFNGLAIFGSKADFTRHLHHRLLTFIHKRNYSYYLSKPELTADFLIEVFGTAYYIEVLNAIYELQPHHADGSPLYDGYLNRELYNIFLQLSLLRISVAEEEEKEKTTSGKEMPVFPTSVETLEAFLKETQMSGTDKRMLLRLLVKENPAILIDWLHTEAVKKEVTVSALITALAEVVDDVIINRLLASVSFAVMEIAWKVTNYLPSHAQEISWLGGISESRLAFVLRRSILLWIGNGHSARPESEGIRQLMSIVYREITGNDPEESEVQSLFKELVTQRGEVNLTDITALTTFLKDIRCTSADKRMLLGIWIKESPDVIMNWLNTEEVKDNASVSALAELADDAFINRLLVSVSFRAMEVSLQVRDYLRSHTQEISWLSGISESRLVFVLRKSILLWIGYGHAVRPEPESLRQLLHLVYREITGNDPEESRLERLFTELDVQGSSVYLADATALTTFLEDIRRTSADKRMLLGTWIKEKPAVILNWLKIEADKDDILVSTLAELADDAIMNRLLASVSFRATEVALQVKDYLRDHAQKISWLDGISESRLAFVLRKSILLWIGNGHSARSEPEGIRQLLSLVYREITGNDKEEDLEQLLTELYLSEKDRKESSEKKEMLSSAAYIKRLKIILDDKSVPEAVKRRMLALFLEQSEDSYVDTVLSLHEQGLLKDALSLINRFVLEKIIRQLFIRISGTSKVTELLPLLYWLVTHESDISTYLRNTTSGLKVQLLVWLAAASQSQLGSNSKATEMLPSLLAALFGEENIMSVVSLMFGKSGVETKIGDAEYYDMETALGSLLDAGQSPFGSKRYSLKQDFKEWKHHSEYIFNIVQTLLESCWNTDENFIGRLEDIEVAADSKQELLQKLVVEKPKEWICLLRKLPRESKEIDLMATRLPASLLLQGMAWTEFYQASVLLQTVEWLQRSADRFIFLTGSNILLSTALSKALLLYMQDKDTLSGRTLTESETLHKFFSYLYLAYTGKTEDYRNDAEWVDLSGKMTADLGTDSWPEIQEKEIADVLLFQETSDTVFNRNVFVFMERQPERLLAWLEKDADFFLIKRIAATSDRMMPGQWIVFLSAASGFEHPNAFKQLMEWFDRISTGWASVSDTISVLLLWLKETNWRKQTPEQMEDYFITRLFGVNTLHLPIERIADTGLPENIRRRLLGNYIRFRPKELSDYIRQSVELNALPLGIWLEWLDINDWMRLATNLSLSRAELLRQTIDYLSESGQAKEADLQTALATCLVYNRADEWIYNNREETVRTFVQSLSALQKNTEMKKEDSMKLIKKALNITAAEDYPQRKQTESPDILFISNAGLCLLARWLPRLLDMLGYLDKDKKDFKDTASKIRIVFLLQYLTCSEEKKYRETELAFNRLLVSLPMNIPLPESLALTDEEKQTAESMLVGVKANWQAMKGTSIKGFQDSFIMRTGRLEQQEERWLLTVDNRTLDILLDSVPWGFKQIRLPWLKKYIQVVWHDKQEF